MTVHSFIERIPVDKSLARRLEELRMQSQQGYCVAALLAPDRRTVVLLGCSLGAPFPKMSAADTQGTVS